MGRRTPGSGAVAVKVERVLRLTRPRHERGVDYNAPRIVLVREVRAGQAVRELVWRMAGKAWGDLLSGYVPMPAHLTIRDLTDGSILGRDVHEGGRLGRPLLALPEVRAKIVAAFGDEVYACLTRINLKHESVLVTL